MKQKPIRYNDLFKVKWKIYIIAKIIIAFFMSVYLTGNKKKYPVLYKLGNFWN